MVRGRIGSAAVFVLVGCKPSWYEVPQLPAHQLTLVEVESRATVLSINGLTPVKPGEPTPEGFRVSETECHEFVVRYDESYIRSNGVLVVAFWNSATLGASLALSVASQPEALQMRFYETDMPIRFHLPPRDGVKYWVTSTFDGDQFHPRVAVLDHSGERTDVILPEQPCPAPASKKI